jgi:hypothetical protein
MEYQFYLKEFENHRNISGNAYPDDKGDFYVYVDFTEGFEGVQFRIDQIDELIESLQELKSVAEEKGYL